VHPTRCLFNFLPLFHAQTARAYPIIVSVLLRTQPERIREVDRIPIGVAVEVEASRDADRVLLGNKPCLWIVVALCALRSRMILTHVVVV
jgi:hypothetical protein